tara:strand:+ start:276 stop:599 length:324 start_codon:yes stop_codon:yes gene_type:complete
MGWWKTKNGKRYRLNIGTASIEKLQKDGARFCRIGDNPGIEDKNNDTYYVAVKESQRTLRECITVKCEDGDEITGYVIHWVGSYSCDGSTDVGEWFIIKPASNPTDI